MSNQADGKPEISAEHDSDDRLDFVVTETASPGSNGFLDNPAEKKKTTEPAEDRLEIANNADLLGGVDDIDDNIPAQPVNLVPPPQEESTVSSVADTAPARPVEVKPNNPVKKEIPPIDWHADSQKQAKSGADQPVRSEEVTKRLNKHYAENDLPPGPRISDESAQSDTALADTVRSISDPALAAVSQQVSQKARGLAYYRKNIIQLVGNPFLHDGDEIVVNNKHYLLRTKKLDKRLAIGLFAALVFVVLAVIASQFIKTNLSGEGEIVGMILNKDGQPYLEGALVSIPSLGKAARTNAQGFFRFELIPTGTYEIVYELGDDYVGQGNVTVTAGQLTVMSFNKPVRREYSQKKNDVTQVTSLGTSSKPSSTTSQTRADKGTSTTTGDQYGKIKVEANVENVRFDLEGQILGAGNNTYSKIRPGERRVILSKAGYDDFVTTIKVVPGETTIINATLKRSQGTQATKITEKDYIKLGYDAMASNNIDQAIADFDKAIDYNHGSVDAYEGRAKAYAMSNQSESAALDYIRVGEIARMAKNNNRAIKAFTSALQHSSKSIAAYVGRAGTYADNGDYRTSIDDFEKALDINDKFYPALYGAGVSYFKMAEYKKAEKYFDKAYKIDASDPYLYQYMMLNYLARDNINKMRDTYAAFKTVAGPAELAEFKSSTRFEPVLRLIKEEDR
nr:tetratricopeptide repeat protein [candidate division Zixibacteria bacterium]